MMMGGRQALRGRKARSGVAVITRVRRVCLPWPLRSYIARLACAPRVQLSTVQVRHGYGRRLGPA